MNQWNNRPSLQHILYTAPLLSALLLAIHLSFTTSTNSMQILSTAGALMYLIPPLITAVKHLDHGYVKILLYFSLLPGTLTLLAHLTGHISPETYTLLAYSSAGLGTWLWTDWLYASLATQAYKTNLAGKNILGFGIIPVFTGTLLGLFLLGLGAYRNIYWARLTGLILLTIGIATVTWLHRRV